MFQGGQVWLQALNQLLFSVRPSTSILAIRDLLQNFSQTNPQSVQLTSRARLAVHSYPHTFSRLEHPCRLRLIESCSRFCMYLCELGADVILLALHPSKKLQGILGPMVSKQRGMLSKANRASPKQQPMRAVT